MKAIDINSLPHDLATKLAILQNSLRALGSVLVAFSGGVDSSLLLAVASDVLGEKAMAVTASCAMYPREETEFAKSLAASLGVKHVTMELDVLSNDAIAANPPDRCYICKKAIFGAFSQLARDEGISHIVDGSNTDDAGDFRPGSRAIKELGVASPLRDADLSKAEVRQLSKAYGLENWHKPAAACLASRIPYGQQLTAENLNQVASAEQMLREMGLKQVRVRHHGEIARIEVTEADMLTLVTLGATVSQALQAIGFRYVTLDLGGYRTGSMNEALSNDVKQAALQTTSPHN